jgi:hypothetical protein
MADDRSVLAWQRRMSAFMTASIIVAALFFAVVTLWQYNQLRAAFTQPPPTLQDPWAGLPGAAATDDQRAELAQTRAAYALERELIARRYNGGNLTVAVRLWTRLMGFITGMILALVGAAFVLGKLSEGRSAAEAKLPGLAASLSVRSASPGIILAFLGTVLMAMAISIEGSFSAADEAIYFRPAGAAVAPPALGVADSPAAPPAFFKLIKPPRKPAPSPLTGHSSQ